MGKNLQTFLLFRLGVCPHVLASRCPRSNDGWWARRPVSGGAKLVWPFIQKLCGGVVIQLSMIESNNPRSSKTWRRHDIWRSIWKQLCVLRKSWQNMTWLDDLCKGRSSQKSCFPYFTFDPNYHIKTYRYFLTQIWHNHSTFWWFTYLEHP